MKFIIIRRASTDIVDGVNTFIFELSSALMKMGHEIKVLTYISNKDERGIKELFDVDLIPEIISLSSKEFRGVLKTWINWFIKGSAVVHKERPNAVIINGIVPIRAGCRTIVVNHGLFKGRRLYQRSMAKLLYKYLPDFVVCVSNKLKNELAKEVGMRAEKIKVIPIGVDTTKFKQKPLEERDKSILHVGSSPQKNLPTTLKAFNIIAAKDCDARLHIFGNWSKAKELIDDLVKEDFKGRVILHGTISRAKLREFYSKSRVVIVPSTYEAFSFVALESMASGTPIVASSALPPEAVVDGFNGFVIDDPSDYVSYADKILALLNDDELWNRLHKNALRYVENYKIDAIARSYIALVR